MTDYIVPIDLCNVVPMYILKGVLPEWLHFPDAKPSLIILSIFKLLISLGRIFKYEIQSLQFYH